MQSIYDEVRKKNDIVSIIEEYGITLRKEGKNHKGLCPFHNDKNPSLVVYPETQSWYCFAEKKGGDVFSFVMQKENCSFQKALKRLADKSGITLPNNIQELDAAFKKKFVRQEILSQIVAYYNVYLLKNKEVCDYFIKERGLSLDILKKYEIGYAPPELHGKLLRYLSAKGFAKEDIVDTGMIYNNGREYLAGHIVFPYMSDGKVVYITGRGYPTKSHKKPFAGKLPQQHLFFEDALRNKEVIIAEGEIDTYTLQQAGFNVCGISGTTGFKEQWVQKFRNVENIYIALDGDEAGQSAALKLGELLKDKARIVSFPTFQTSDKRIIKDWNELHVQIHKGNVESFKTAFQKLLTEAPKYLDFKIAHLFDHIAGDRISSLFKSEIIPELIILSPTEQDYYIGKLIQITNGTIKLTRQSIRTEMKNAEIERLNDNSGLEILNGNFVIISPAQDFVDGVGYITIPVACKPKNQPKLIMVDHLITSNKEIILLDDIVELERRKIVFEAIPYFVDMPRWKYHDILKFINTKNKPNPCKTYVSVLNQYKKHVDFYENLAPETMAIWSLGTYFFKLFPSYPYIFLTGPKVSGKTQTCVLASKLCFNGLHLITGSPSSLFRTTQGSSATLFIDEAEDLKDASFHRDILAILNAGYHKAGVVTRTNIDTLKPEKFYVYSPKLVANIGGLPDVTESRCITFRMLRANKSVEYINQDEDFWCSMRHNLYVFALTFFHEIQEIYLDLRKKEIDPSLIGREGELWLPLISIAAFLDVNGLDGLESDIVDTAIKKSKESKASSLGDVMLCLLYALRNITLETEVKITTKMILNKMSVDIDDESELPGYKKIASMLSQYCLYEDKKHSNTGTLYKIRHATVLDVMHRYGLDYVEGIENQ